MGIISVEKANHLYWLGRYTERVFITLRKFFHVYDSMIELEKAEENPDSIYSNMMRAYDNAIILREELSSNVLSYIQLSLDTIKSAERSSAPLVSLQPVIDYLFAFWGCVDDYVEEEECRNLMKIGRYAERIYVVGMMIGEGYTHAWVEIYLEDGWYGLDPADNLQVDDYYIKIAHGRDYSDCVVDGGVFRGVTTQEQEIFVKVEEINICSDSKAETN